MTNDELRALLTKRVEQGNEMLALIKRRPHHNKMFTVTLRSAAEELVNACHFLNENLGQPLFNEEGVKAYLMDRYIEFARCRDRVMQDFREMDEQP
jgi:hypothetical protein